MKKIKILQFICTTGLFGAERWILALANNYRNHESIELQLVITYESSLQNIEVFNKFRELGLNGHIIRSRGRFDINTILKLLKLIKKEEINIVHSHGYKSDIIGIIAARLSGIKAIAVPHGFENVNDLKLQFFIKIGCLALRFFDRVVPLSDELYNDMLRLKIKKSRVKLILNGLDLKEVEKELNSGKSIRYPKKVNEKIIGYVGQISSRKNIGALIEVFVQLYKNVNNIRLLIIGDGPLKSKFEKDCKGLSCSSRIEFLGYRDDRLRFIKDMDLFSMTSSLEGIPRCMMEAMALGTPVAAFKIPGINKLIVNGKTGLLADYGNVKMLKSCWQKILFDKKVAEKLSKNARNHVLKNFSAARMANEYTNLFHELMV